MSTRAASIVPSLTPPAATGTVQSVQTGPQSVRLVEAGTVSMEELVIGSPRDIGNVYPVKLMRSG